MFSYTANKRVIKTIMDKSRVYIIRNEREFFSILSRYVKYHCSEDKSLDTETAKILLIIYMEKDEYKICLINFAAKENKHIAKYAYCIPIIMEEAGDISFRYLIGYNITSFITEKESYTPVFTLIPRIKPPILLNQTNIQPICFAENASLMIGYVDSNTNIRYFCTELIIMDFYAEKRPIILNRNFKLSNIIVNKHFPNQSKIPNSLFSLGKNYSIYFLNPKRFVVTSTKCNNTVKQLENCIGYGYMGIPLHILSLS